MGGDRGGWALDTEARLARECLEKIPGIDVVDSLYHADLVHTVWPEQLLEDPACGAVLAGGRPVVASFSNDPWALFERVPGFFSLAKGWNCVAQGSKARRELEALGVKRVFQVNYAADFGKFPIRAISPAERLVLRKKFGLPENAYLISSFQRDAEGADLSRPKMQKGPDIFGAVLLEAQRRLGRGSFHVVLGGPRRHWLRKELRRLEIPFTFVGRETAEDDYPWQNLPLAEVAQLLGASDLNLVTSRWEGAPRALMEAVALGVPALSTAEGIAEDLLDPQNIFRSLPEAVEKLVLDVRGGGLREALPAQARRLEANHSIPAVRAQWERTYASLKPSGAVRPTALRDYPVHHPRLHRWLRRVKAVEARVRLGTGLGPRMKVMQVTGADLTSEKDLESREPGVFTAFSSLSVWLAALRAGWQPACPGIVRPAVEEKGHTPGNGVQWFTGNGSAADREAAAQWVSEFPGSIPFQDAPAELLVCLSPDVGVIAKALAAGMPVVYPDELELRELVGYAGLHFDRSPESLRAAVKAAWEFREGLSLCTRVPARWEYQQRLATLAAFAARGVFG